MLVRINSRLHSFPDGLSFAQVKKGHYTAEFNGHQFTIVGGKASGGSANEWFVETPDGGKPIYTTGLVDSLKLITNY